MTVIKINAITVPADAGDELARRFAAHAGAVDNQEGFEGFELLRPTDDRRQWLVVTRWRDEESFGAWVSSPAFAHGHAGADRPSPHGGPVSVASEFGGPTRWPAARRRGRAERARALGGDHGEVGIGAVDEPDEGPQHAGVAGQVDPVGLTPISNPISCAWSM